MLQLFEQIAGYRCLMMYISGEPGIGKTTLVEDFLYELASDAARPCQIGRGRCSERLEGTGAYLPFLEAMESLLHTAQGDIAARAMKLLAPTWYSQVRTLSEDAVGLEIRKATSLERLKRELVSFLQEASALPIILFLDDLHWADSSTVDLINYLASRFDRMRVLIIGTYRAGDLRLTKHPILQVKLDLEARGTCSELE